MRKALFLDRDGVINKEINYLHRIEDVVFFPEIFDICRFYQANGFLFIVVTNQAGIARGFYSDNDVDVLHRWMIGQFEDRGIHIDKIYYCPHHPDFTGPCTCRKPNPGMIFEAAHEFDIDLPSSILIGDKQSDIDAGKNAGIENLYFFDDLRPNLKNLPLPR